MDPRRFLLMPHALLSASETAEALGVAAETVRRLYRSSSIPGYKVGRYLRFDLAEVRDALRSSTSDDATPVTVAPDFDAVDA